MWVLKLDAEINFQGKSLLTVFLDWSFKKNRLIIEQPTTVDSDVFIAKTRFVGKISLRSLPTCLFNGRNREINKTSHSSCSIFNVNKEAIKRRCSIHKHFVTSTESLPNVQV